MKTFDCPYCDSYKDKVYLFNHIATKHKEESEKIQNIVVKLAKDSNFYSYSLHDYKEIPNWLTWDDVKKILQEKLDKKAYKDKITENRTKCLQIAFAMRNQHLPLEEAKEYVKNEINRDMRCSVCNAWLTENNWINHMQQHEDTYISQVRKIIQLFDNLDCYKTEHFINAGINCNNEIAAQVWKRYFGEENYKIRTYLLTGRMSAIKRFGTIKTNIIDWNTENDDKLTLDELINKHSEIIRIYLKRKNEVKEFHPHAGSIIPRIDLPEIKGCRSSWEANVYRILKFEHKRFRTEIAFRIPDLNHKTRRGYCEYLVDFQDIDNFFGFGNNVYFEIKGRFGEDAKYKKEMFLKTYPDKKLCFIGLDDPENNFFPEVKYNDLEKHYKHLIPLWETKTDSVFNNPTKFLPKKMLAQVKEHTKKST